MQQSNPQGVYENNIARLNGYLAAYKQKDRLIVTIKLILILAAAAIIIKLIPLKTSHAIPGLIILFILFVAVAILHERMLKAKQNLQTLKTINENEISALDNRFLQNMNDGLEFKNPEHPYTPDLDIFGPRSVFHYINRAVTSMGREQMAKSLETPLSPKKIRIRQKAVAALTGKINFRQNLLAHGLSLEDTTGKTTAIYKLIKDPPWLKGKKVAIFFIYLLPLITMGLFAALTVGIPLGVPLLAMCGQFIINGLTFGKVTAVYKQTGKYGKILKAYARIIRDIEEQPFEDSRLTELQKGLTDGHITASRCIKKLSILLEWFDMRLSGSIHFLVNNILLWDLHCVYRIEKWKGKAGSRVKGWFDIIAEMETLVSFANVHFNNPDWCMPQIEENKFTLNATELGHPLISSQERVSNDYTPGSKGNIVIVTGPNMAGKSTFLRTLGVNSVLAMAGGPVCATQFEISPFKLMTSMQSSDSLDKHLSLFYAELQRLKIILEAIDHNEPVFFMIDEMLKGTNALDRHKGSVALINQLIRNKANGVLATHDMELTHIENRSQGVRNYHFDGNVENDKLIFDFKLKEGPCTSANALALMKIIGIDL